MKMTAFWDIALCRLFALIMEAVALMLKAICTSETSVSDYETARLNISEDC
jgi:hypothetical protein